MGGVDSAISKASSVCAGAEWLLRETKNEAVNLGEGKEKV